jgi:hypothetical protein
MAPYWKITKCCFSFRLKKNGHNLFPLTLSAGTPIEKGSLGASRKHGSSGGPIL